MQWLALLLLIGVSPYVAGPEVRLGLRPDPAKRLWVRGSLPPPLPSAEMDPFMLVDPAMGVPLSDTPDFREKGPTPPEELSWLRGMRYPDVPVVFDEAVVKYLKWFRYSRSGQATARAWIRASGRYRIMILDALRRHRLPTIFLYVAMIESGFRPHVRSWAGAAGLWQFLKSGADIYGLEVSHWVDDRLDPEMSTEAAMYYLSDLLHRFGRWELAAGAYNCGYGRMLQAMRRYSTNDYWTLSKYENAIPQETRLYVPKILALAIVDLNRDRFGLKNLTLEKPYSFDLVDAPGGLSLKSIARKAGMDPEVLYSFNPEYVRKRLPPRKVVPLRVPPGMGDRVRRAITRLRSWWKDYTVHRLQLGETLADVARNYGISRRKLRKLNSIQAEQELAVGTPLLVPKHRLRVSDKPSERPFVAVPKGMKVPAGHDLYFYRTTRYDTVESIASSLGIPAARLREWNLLLPGASLASSMYLMVFVPKGARPHRALIPASRCDVVEVDSDEFHAFYLDKVDKVRVVHTVRRGETLKSIARRYGSKARWIRNLNRLRGSSVEPGTKLVVYARKSKVRRRKKSRNRAKSKRVSNNATGVAKPGKVGAKSGTGSAGVSSNNKGRAGKTPGRDGKAQAQGRGTDAKKRTGKKEPAKGRGAGKSPDRAPAKNTKKPKTAPAPRTRAPVAPSGTVSIPRPMGNAWTGSSR